MGISIIPLAFSRIITLTGYFGDWREVEHDCQCEYKATNGKVGPLYILQSLRIVARVLEKHVGRQDGRRNSSNTIESLREIDSDFRVLGGTTNCEVRIGCCFKRSKPTAHDEGGPAEAAKRSVHKAWPGDQSADTVQEETPNEDGLVAPVSQQPVCMAKGGKWVGTKVSCLESGRARACDTKRLLEVFVQCVDKAV